MPLIVEGGRVPTRWAEKTNGCRVPLSGKTSAQGRVLRLAFINNMPDAALEDTELQFFGLLDAASGDVPVYVKLYSLTGVPRGERGLQHLSSFYCDFNDLWKNKCDGAIITGTEPREPNLRDEPYWKLLAEVFDWAGRETTSTILSCLAAHASVLHNDGIARHRLPDKQFGVFESDKTGNDCLTNGMPAIVRFPHSRWNEVREADLVSAGYSVITKSKDAGADLFTKKCRHSLFVHFQGHPEYGAETLFKEYRRDVRRFLRKERETYPSMPKGYFDESSVRAFSSFQVHAIADQREEVMTAFPESAIQVRNTWHEHALSAYRGWMRHISVRTKPEIASVSHFQPVEQKDLGMPRTNLAYGN